MNPCQSSRQQLWMEKIQPLWVRQLHLIISSYWVCPLGLSIPVTSSLSALYFEVASLFCTVPGCLFVWGCSIMWRTLIYVVASSIEGDLSFDSNLSYEAASYCQATSCYEEPSSCEEASYCSTVQQLDEVSSGKSADVNACLALFFIYSNFQWFLTLARGSSQACLWGLRLFPCLASCC